jgi:hypothetical protein
MTVVDTGDQLGAGLGQGVLLHERQRERLARVAQLAELVDAGDRSVVDVVVDGVAVLREEREVRDQVLGQVGDRDDQQRAGMVRNPRVVPLKVRLLPRNVEAIR